MAGVCGPPPRPFYDNIDAMQNYCFLNGEIKPLSEAKISINDIGLLRGYGVYDGITAIGDRIFRFTDHWNRFVDGAHTLNLNIPITEEKCEKVLKELLVKNGFERSIIRLMLTGGETYGGIDYRFEEPTFYILVEKWDPLPSETYSKGGKLVTYPFMRDMPLVKTTNYIRGVNLQNWRREEGALEILFVKDNEVTECATSNICIVKDGKILTPAEHVLKGITLKVVSELAEVEEKLISENDLLGADEVFITSSFKDIVPVTKVDDSVIGNGEVGPVTRGVMEAFAKVLKTG